MKDSHLSPEREGICVFKCWASRALGQEGEGQEPFEVTGPIKGGQGPPRRQNLTSTLVGQDEEGYRGVQPS